MLLKPRNSPIQSNGKQVDTFRKKELFGIQLFQKLPRFSTLVPTRAAVAMATHVMRFPLGSKPVPDFTSFVRFPHLSQLVAMMITSLKWGIFTICVDQ